MMLLEHILVGGGVRRCETWRNDYFTPSRDETGVCTIFPDPHQYIIIFFLDSMLIFFVKSRNTSWQQVGNELATKLATLGKNKIRVESDLSRHRIRNGREHDKEA